MVNCVEVVEDAERNCLTDSTLLTNRIHKSVEKGVRYKGVFIAQTPYCLSWGAVPEIELKSKTNINGD